MTATTVRIRRFSGSLFAVLILASACSPSPTASPTTAPASPSASTPLPASPTPGVTPVPTQSPSSSPAALEPGWTYAADGELDAIRFAPDGGIVTVEHSSAITVRRLAADGTTVAGWPWYKTNANFADAAFGPDGSTYVIARNWDDAALDRWTLHRIDAHGIEMAGFPVVLPAVEACRIAVATDGSAVTACSGEAVDEWVTTVTRVRPDGTVARGWPMRVHGDASPLGFLHNGDLVLLDSDYVAPEPRGFVRVVLVTPRGIADPAWQATRYPDISTVALSKAGLVIVTSREYADGECGAAVSTTYRLLDEHGRTTAGWPIAIRGWGSDPVVRADSSLVIATAGGRVAAWSAGGRTLAGWPAKGVDVQKGCSGGSTPVATPGGGVVVVGSKHVAMLDGRGAAVRGWPVTLTDRVALSCMGCTPGPSGQVPTAVTVSGVFVPVSVGASGQDWQPKIVLFDLAGHPMNAWDGLVGLAGDEIVRLLVAPDGRVWAIVGHRTDAGPVDSLVLVAP